MVTAATLFSGGEGFGVGVKAAGVRLVWGIEKDGEIAAVANGNLGEHVVVGDVREVDPAGMERVDLLHASPPCPNFSPAKAGARETELDRELGQVVARFVEVLRPRWFTLENVWGYRRSEAWGIIREALYRVGYWLDVAHVNAADFGVPQTRKRMLVRAARGSMVPYLLEAEEWVGWYSSIADLVEEMPESRLAAWQERRLGEKLRETVLVSGQYAGGGWGGERMPGVRKVQEPAFTVRGRGGDWRGVLFSNADTRWGDGMRNGEEPAFSVTESSGGRLRGLIGAARVVQITDRGLARFQAFPDWYELPERRALASRVIGNAVPPLLAEKVVGQLVGYGS